MNSQEPVTGIVLKRIPLGEADTLVTVFTQEWGVIRAVAKGARKTPSRWGGRTELFMTGRWRVTQGRWRHPEARSDQLYRLTEMEILYGFRGLSRQLERLLAAQYLGEVALMYAPPGHAQPELYVLVIEHLHRLENATPEGVLPCLCHALYHVLASAGLAPQVFHCHSCRCPVPTSLEEVGLSLTCGGIVCENCHPTREQPLSLLSQPVWLGLQRLPQPVLDTAGIPMAAWVGVERVLRRIVEFHSERRIQSASLLPQLGLRENLGQPHQP